MSDAWPIIPCPKCGRKLPAEGEVLFERMVIPAYSCPECVTWVTFMGERMELPLTFIIGPDGRAYDPAVPDGEVDLTKYE